MENLIKLLKLAKFYAHDMHQLAKGQTFFQDHAFLGELYEAYDSEYDDCVERSIGLGIEPNLPNIIIEAANTLKSLPHNEHCFLVLNNLEKAIRAEIAKISPSASLGSQNLYAQIADDSEVRSYKLQQRMKQ